MDPEVGITIAELRALEVVPDVVEVVSNATVARAIEDDAR